MCFCANQIEEDDNMTWMDAKSDSIQVTFECN